MNYFLITGLALGFLGSFHCAGMCGPIALAVGEGIGNRNFIPKILYNTGRVVTYGCMGFFTGLLGKSFNIIGYQDQLSILAGVLIIAMVLFSDKRIASRFTGFTLKITSAIRDRFKAMIKKKNRVAVLGIGMLNGLLPCGFVYIALAGSVAGKSVTESVLYMILFGLGTIPVMLLLTFAGSLIPVSARSRINALKPVIAVALALFLIWRGLEIQKPKDCCRPGHSMLDTKNCEDTKIFQISALCDIREL